MTHDDEDGIAAPYEPSLHDQTEADIALLDTAHSEVKKIRAMLVQVEDRLGAASELLDRDFRRCEEYAQHLGAWLSGLAANLAVIGRSRTAPLEINEADIPY